MRHMTHGSDRWAGARLRPPNVRTKLAALAGACALLATAAPALAGGKHEAEEDSKVATRRHRWWEDGWAHSMQEQCFIDWMDALFGTTIWRHSMQEQDVEWIYEWWSAVLWVPPELQAAD